ncbi:hypothetical protein [Nocardia crassostreae]|uniref:hypothetical protein n=1 Tax=Nocardia crassostreae TaxID=53428 RepID=UPI00082E6B4F|nr:hypothetical protein [Nocardia crassostreae]
MFESCCSPYESAHLLRTRYGLPVEVFADRPYLTTGRTVETVNLPAELGRRVRLALSDRSATPVIADPRELRWLFLVAPPTPYHPVPNPLLRRLLAYGASVPQPGSRIMLPREDGPEGWHWACEPEPGPLSLPHRVVVLTAVRQAILQGADHISA